MSTTTNIAQAIALLSETLSKEASKLSEEVPVASVEDDTEEEVVSEDTFNELQDLAIEITNEVEDALEDIRDDLEAEIDDEVDDDFDDEVDDDELDDESDSAADANEETDSDESIESITLAEPTDDSDAESTLEEQNEKLVEENDILNLALRAALDKVENLLSVVESYRDDLNAY